MSIGATPPGDEAQTCSPSLPFGAMLGPTLQRACGDRLSETRWFRTDWQRGGALTGYAAWADERERAHAVVVKLPVPPIERQWLVRLQVSDDAPEHEHVVPRLFAHGDSLNGYDLAWVVMERLPYGPLGDGWPDAGMPLLLDAAGRFYAAAERAPLAAPPPSADWVKLLKTSRDRFRQRGKGEPMPHAERWKKALKAADRRLGDWLERWHARPREHWCHGDLHHGNAMTRRPPPAGPALLLDFAQVRVGHWVEDAVYLEQLHWAHPHKLAGHKPAKQLAQLRRERGLAVGDDWPELARVYRALLALAAPAQHHRHGDPRHLAAALHVLEQHV